MTPPLASLARVDRKKPSLVSLVKANKRKLTKVVVRATDLESFRKTLLE